MSGRKLKKSFWLPLCLGIYGLAMTLFFAPRLIEEGQTVKLGISIAVEIIVISGLFFALKRKEKLASRWNSKEPA